MTRPRKRLWQTVGNRGATAYEVATYLGMSEGEFKNRLQKLRAAGFPKPDPLIGRYDRAAIDRWWNLRSGLLSTTLTEELTLDERLRHYGQAANPAPGN